MSQPCAHIVNIRSLTEKRGLIWKKPLVLSCSGLALESLSPCSFQKITCFLEFFSLRYWSYADTSAASTADTQRLPSIVIKKRAVIPTTLPCILSYDSPLSSLDFTGFQTRSTYIHFLCSAVHFHFHGFHIRSPHLTGFSMGMTYALTKMNTLIANCTPSHFHTSYYSSASARSMPPVSGRMSGCIASWHPSGALTGQMLIRISYFMLLWNHNFYYSNR